jgi:protein-tyrosine-phosphatase
VRELREAFGIGILGQYPRHLDALPGRRFDRVITVCDKARGVRQEVPRYPRRVHRSVPEPATAGDTDQASHPAFQRTATDIDTRIRHLLPVLATTHHKEV